MSNADDTERLVDRLVNIYGELSCDTCGEMFVPTTSIGGEALETTCSKCEGSSEKDIFESKHFLSEFINLVIETKIREADVSDGTKVKFGSDQHVKDLEIRIADLTRWRDRQGKRSEARANYSRLISRLRNELRSARRSSVNTGHKMNVKDNA